MEKPWEVPVYFCVDAENPEIAWDKVSQLLKKLPKNCNFIIEEPIEIIGEQ